LLQDHTARGIGLLFSSHQLELIERLADRVVIIDGGKIVANEMVDPTDRGVLADRFRELIGFGTPAAPRVRKL
jgi:ABC-2 type transport system ATP-binding protein